MWIDRSNSCMTGYTEVELRIEISNFLFADNPAIIDERGVSCYSSVRTELKRLAGSSVMGFQFCGSSHIITTHADQVGAEDSNLLGIRPRLDHGAGCPERFLFAS
jgi:hypothetical protein